MTRYKETYRVESARHPTWDYASEGWYFVTICTQDRIGFFGDVVNGIMQLSVVGRIADECWRAIPDHFDNCVVDEFVVMPNHVHGIVVITTRRDVACNVSTTPPTGITSIMSDISPKPGSLSAIVRSYKAAVTHRCRVEGHDTFAWQSRFYDRIIRDQHALDAARTYVRYNPGKWSRDRDHPSDLFM